MISAPLRTVLVPGSLSVIPVKVIAIGASIEIVSTGVSMGFSSTTMGAASFEQENATTAANAANARVLNAFIACSI